ncbi:cysteine hydrolase family protein [Aurantiacibacter suaedae]|uniref:cysteine hydrolase family protein n=1 Tax=Aurantiacibacter suaedae TaxID=2545755 RepID=UPI0010FA6321|nr:cysteine hydrolase family protein [Aurantiacibacter suaedae]
MSKRALVVVDLQNEYLPSGKVPLEGIHDAIANATEVLAHFRKSGETLVHIRHELTADAPMFVPGSDGVNIVPEMKPEGNEPVVTKNYPNAFRDTDLKKILEENSVKEIVFIGAMSHMCIAASVRAAVDFGYSAVTVHDACATMDLEFNNTKVPVAQVHAANMAALEFAYGEVVSTDKLLAS